MEIKRLSLELMETAEAVYLSTIDVNGFPQIRAMLNLRNKKQFPSHAQIFEAHDEDFLVYLTTNTASAKVSQITANPKASLYFCEPSRHHGLMLAGAIEIVIDADIKEQLWRDDWKIYYPAGLGDLDYTILRFLPAFAKGWLSPRIFEFDIDSKR